MASQTLISEFKGQNIHGDWGDGQKRGFGAKYKVSLFEGIGCLGKWLWAK